MRKTTFFYILLTLLLIIAGLRFFGPADAVKNAVPEGLNIICFGNSLTYGTGASRGMDYPAQLSRMISLPVINAGIPGNTTADALSRVKTDVLDKSPRIVLITLGGNDLKNRVPKEVAFHNLKQIVQAIQNAGALVIIGGVDIPLRGRGYGNAYKELAKETGSVLIPNVFDGILGHKDLMYDPIHPNDKGYTLMAKSFYAAIQPYL